MSVETFKAIRHAHYRWLPRSFNGQLILFTSLSLALAIMGFGTYTANREAQLATRTLETQMAVLARNLASVSANYILTGDLSGIEDVNLQTVGFPSIRSIVVVDTHGTPLSEVVVNGDQFTPRYSNQQIVLPANDKAFTQINNVRDTFFNRNFLPESNQEASYWFPIRGGSLLGWIRITYSLDGVRDSILRAWRDALLFSGLAVIAAMTLLAYLLRRPMRALKAATQFAGDLDSHRGEAIPIVSATIELESLIHALNNVSARLRAQENALHESADHMRNILDNAIDGIITIDREGIIQSFSQSAERIFGYRQEEIRGRNVKILMSEPHQSKHDGYLRNYYATGDARIIGTNREVEGLRKDGSTFPMDLAVSRSTYRGQPLFIGLVRDITEHKRVEKMKSEFVSTISHELRTPLTSISGALALMNDGVLGELPSPVKSMLDMAHKNSLRLALLINDLLDMEKLAAGKMRYELKSLPLMPLVESAIASVVAYGQQYQVQFNLVSRADVNVYVDGVRLHQVFSNLLSNAAKFSPEGGQVEVAVHQGEGRVRVDIVDHGPGISEAFRNRIFQKFTQADSTDARPKGGTGLGLAISKEITEHMGGVIGFKSEEGQGATFFIELPLA